MRASTRTVTIVVTDLVGSTELFARAGAEPAERLRTQHFGLLERTVAFHDGRVVKNLGDGLMLAFDGITDAVRCAVAMQRAVEDDSRRRREPMHIRVGISLGEATVTGDDVFGDPVVEACRLCALAESGQILANEMVRVLAGSRTGIEFSSVGALVLKGLPEPVPAVEALWAPADRRRIRAVLADDAMLVREGVARLLEEQDVEVVAQAGDLDQLLAAVRAHRPDIAITDVRMPPTNTMEGLEAAERIRAEHPGVAVLLLSQHLESRYALRLAAGGVSGIGYLLKERVTDIDEFAAVARRVAAGGTAIDAEVVDALITRRRADVLSELDEDELGLVGEIARGDRDDPAAAEVRALGERLGLGADGSIVEGVLRLLGARPLPLEAA